MEYLYLLIIAGLPFINILIIATLFKLWRYGEFDYNWEDEICILNATERDGIVAIYSMVAYEFTAERYSSLVV